MRATYEARLLIAAEALSIVLNEVGALSKGPIELLKHPDVRPFIDAIACRLDPEFAPDELLPEAISSGRQLLLTLCRTQTMPRRDGNA
jgi:hypothetical protein